MNERQLFRFWQKVDLDFETGCWPWKLSLNTYGYGQFWLNGKYILAHRVSYEEFIGKIPQGLTIDHLCRNRKCVNPKHLEAVTMKENNNRGVGPTAINKRKTHCIRGHEFTKENIIKMKNGRQCLLCHRISNKKYNESKKHKI